MENMKIYIIGMDDDGHQTWISICSIHVSVLKWLNWKSLNKFGFENQIIIIMNSIKSFILYMSFKSLKAIVVVMMR